MVIAMDEAQISQKIVDLIAEVTADSSIGANPDRDLFEAGSLDSMAAIELLVSLEEQLDVIIAPTEVPRGEMNTVNKIIARVSERL